MESKGREVLLELGDILEGLVPLPQKKERGQIPLYFVFYTHIIDLDLLTRLHIRGWILLPFILLFLPLRRVASHPCTVVLCTVRIVTPYIL